MSAATQIAGELCNSGQSALDNHRASVDMVGEEVVDRAIARLPPELAAEYRETLAVSWIRIGTVEAAMRAIAAEAGRPFDEFHAEVVRRGVERSARGPWRMLLRITTDEALVKRTPLLYARAFNMGTLSSRVVGPGHSQLELEGCPGASTFVLKGLGYGIETVLRTAGRANVSVTYQRTPGGARFEARWTKG